MFILLSIALRACVAVSIYHHAPYLGLACGFYYLHEVYLQHITYIRQVEYLKSIKDKFTKMDKD